MNDTIAALSTAPYESAVGIIRLSGPESFIVAAKLFYPVSGENITKKPRREMVYGRMKNADGKTVDYGMCVLFEAPASYTGENMAELFCHGSPAVLEALLSSACLLGVRRAEAGEFTRRAFLNGKLDLIEAEAVADIISAKSETAAIMSAGQLGGQLSRRVEDIYSVLTGLCAHFQAVADYPDEDIEPFNLPALAEALEIQESKADGLIRAYERGKFIREGIPCAIIGRPNTGKSSLLNALLGYSRAIVTDIPGTTRDTLEETVLLKGQLFRLIDTAGLRESGDTVERIGVRRAIDAAREAEIIIAVFDISLPLTPEDYNVFKQISEICSLSDEKKCLFVLNKSDLPTAFELPEVIKNEKPVYISALTGKGLDELADALNGLIKTKGDVAGEIFLSNARQLDAVIRAKEAIIRAKDALSGGMTADAVLFDIEDALSILAEITGRSVTSDIIDDIFSRFCVGK